MERIELNMENYESYLRRRSTYDDDVRNSLQECDLQKSYERFMESVRNTKEKLSAFGVDTSLLSLRNFKTLAMLSVKTKDLPIVVDGDTMSFICRGNEWNILEESDEPSRMDIYLMVRLTPIFAFFY